MNKQATLCGYLLKTAALTFWAAWFLMPDPGTTDTTHILSIVKQSRQAVISSVGLQIASSVLYIAALFSLTNMTRLNKKAWVGAVLMGIGAMGLCADAFFHLIAYYMTDNSVTVQQDIVTVMNFMQSNALVFLIPLLLPFFLGTYLLASGLYQRGTITRMPLLIIGGSLLAGILVGTITHLIPGYNGPSFILAVLGIFATGQAFLGFDLMGNRKSAANLVPGLQTFRINK